jgi:YesN/AraC family two-component response regulator
MAPGTNDLARPLRVRLQPHTQHSVPTQKLNGWKDTRDALPRVLAAQQVGPTTFMPKPSIPETCKKPIGSRRRQQLVQWMLDYIHEHYSRPMQLGDLAAAMNMNAAYLSDLFSTNTGVTFHHYLEELRLAKAKDLLRDPLRRVSEVAYATGYADPDYFRRAFKARVGVAPSAWRTTSKAASRA